MNTAVLVSKHEDTHTHKHDFSKHTFYALFENKYNKIGW